MYDALKNAACYGSDVVPQSMIETVATTWDLTGRSLSTWTPRSWTDWWNHSAADVDSFIRDIMLTTLGRALQDFCNAEVKLQPVGSHPWGHVIDARRYSDSLTCRRMVSWRFDCHQHTCVDVADDYINCIQKEKDLSWDRALRHATLHIWRSRHCFWCTL